MTSFERDCACPDCGREYLVAGSALNPSNETQAPTRFACACGGDVMVFLPGSANQERVTLTPRPALPRAPGADKA